MNSVEIRIGSQSGKILANTVFPYSYGNLLEETKLLESVTCGELAFTNTKAQAFADDTFVVVE